MCREKIIRSQCAIKCPKVSQYNYSLRGLEEKKKKSVMQWVTGHFRLVNSLSQNAEVTMTKVHSELWQDCFDGKGKKPKPHWIKQEGNLLFYITRKVRGWDLV